MTWEPFVGAGVALALAALGQWLWAVKLGTRLDTEGKEMDRRMSTIETSHSTLNREVGDFSRRVEREFVAKTDLEKVEDRLGRLFTTMLEPVKDSLNKVDHNLRSVEQKLDTRIMNMIRPKARDNE